MIPTVTIQDVFKANQRIRAFVRHTPLAYSHSLSALQQSPVYLKLENLQLTGSFKPRGAFNVLQQLSVAARRAGVVAPTAGNHGIALAYAAWQMDIPAHIFVSKTVDPMKRRVLESYRARLTVFDSIEDAHVAAQHAATAQGLTFVSAYNDPRMVAAAGTVALEIVHDLPDLEVALVCIGGGGLLAGIGTVLKAINPAIEVWGVQTANSPTFARWIEVGGPVPVDLQPSIADGLSGYIEPETITFPIVKAVADGVITVREEELIAAVHWMIEHHQHIIEPSGVAAVAALLQQPSRFVDRKVVATVTGQNIGLESLKTLLAAPEAPR